MLQDILSFENKVMEKMLDGNVDILCTLRKQFKMARVESRIFTGVGFYTQYSIPKEAPIIKEAKSFQLGDVIGEIEGVPGGVGFVLFIKEGAIHLLEAYTYGEYEWPESITNYKLSYISGDNRDLDKIRAILK
jgi:hypothetical protein